MLKEPIYFSAPNRISVNFVCPEEDEAYAEAAKGFVHAIIIPFVLSWIHPLVASAYFIAVSFLYLTVFRSKSQGYWRVVLFFVSMAALFIVSF